MVSIYDMRSLNINFPRSISKFESAMRKRLKIKTIFYRKVFRGKGPEFDSYRVFGPDDDANLIDWKTTMRARRPMIKQYIEERDLKIFFIIDIGDSMIAGSEEKLKNEVAAEIAAALSHLIITSGDSVGFALYNGKINKMKHYSKGLKQFYVFAKQLSDPKNYGGGSDLKKTLDNLFPYLSGTSAVFIISDFLNIDSGTQKILKQFSSKYETIGIMVRDPIDTKLPDLNKEVIIEDPSTGQQLLIKPSLIRYQYEQNAMQQKRQVEKIFRDSCVDLVDIQTNEDFVDSLVNFLKGRVKRGRYISPKR